MQVPNWLLSADPTEVDFGVMNADLVQTFERKILANIPLTEDREKLRSEAVEKFAALLGQINLGIEERNKAIAAFNSHVVPEIAPPNKEGVDPLRLEAKANMASMIAVMDWRILQDAYILWAITDANTTGWWKNIGGAEEFVEFGEFVQDIVAKQIEKDPHGSNSSNWKWISGRLIPMLQEHGMPINKAIAAVSLKSKLRFAVSRMRFIEQQYQDDPDEAYTRIAQIIEEEVLNPNVSARDIASKAPNSRSGQSIAKIPGSATGFVVTNGEGGGLMTIRVGSAAEAKAIERSLGGLIDEENSSPAFFPRDELAYVNEMKHTLANGSKYEPLREPLSTSQVQKMTKEKAIKVVIPYTLDDLIRGGEDVYRSKILAYVGEGWKVKSRAICGFMSDEVHILFTLEE